MKHLDSTSRWLWLLTILLAVCAASFIAATAAEAQATGSIKGKVFDEVTSNPVAGIYVGAFDVNEQARAMVQTGADGNYELTGLPLGTYKIYFLTYGTDYVAQWYNNAATFQAAQSVELTSGNPEGTTGETRLATGGTINGIITDAAVSAPISAVTVQAFDVSNSEIWFSGTTNTTGSYSITGLRAGSYKIRFRAFGTDYITAWYSVSAENNAATDENNATPVTIESNAAVSQINAKLTVGGTISGKVSIKETESGLVGARVNVYSSNNVLKGFATTGEQGLYTVSGLPSDSTYKVQFFERVVNKAGSGINKWYSEKSDFVSADSVAIGENAVDAAFSGAAISGTVTGQKNGLLPNVTVKAYDSVGNVAASSQLTGDDGVYKIEGLKRGNYRLYFEMPAGSQYSSEWHSDKSNIAQANPVAINSLGDRLTINAVMQPPSKAAKLIPIYKQLLLKKRCYIINGVRVCR